MWKYVGQRLKDSTDLYSYIKNLRSTFSTCNAKSSQEVFDKKHDGQEDDHFGQFIKCGTGQNGRMYNVWIGLDDEQSDIKRKNRFDIDTPYVIQKLCEKQKQKQKQKYYQTFTGGAELCLLQWTAGFLASLYFGQMICLYSRRRANLKRWNHMEQLLTERSLRQTIESASIYQRSFVPSNDNQQHWFDAKQMRHFQSFMPLIPVTNDHVNQNQHISTSATQAAVDQQSNSDLSLAVDDLIATLGSIEFKLGMQNMQANEPEVAVSHLKLATTHRHPEATFNLGVCYEIGVGVDKSMKNAMECYRLAASLGHKKAMYNLGVFYVHGHGGLKKNHDAARACFEAAEKMGLRQAKKALNLPEKPIEKNNKIVWKSNDLMANRLSAVHLSRESSVI